MQNAWNFRNSLQNTFKDFQKFSWVSGAPPPDPHEADPQKSFPQTQILDRPRPDSARFLRIWVIRTNFQLWKLVNYSILNNNLQRLPEKSRAFSASKSLQPWGFQSREWRSPILQNNPADSAVPSYCPPLYSRKTALFVVQNGISLWYSSYGNAHLQEASSCNESSSDKYSEYAFKDFPSLMGRVFLSYLHGRQRLSQRVRFRIDFALEFGRAFYPLRGLCARVNSRAKEFVQKMYTSVRNIVDSNTLFRMGWMSI